jgi:curved DNA-binding protein CbpA
MDPLEERRCRRILEVAPGASLEEITRAYRLLRQLHGQDTGIFAAPAMDEFSAEARRDALEAIETAYAALSAPETREEAPAAQDVQAARPVPDAPAARPALASVPPGAATALGRARDAAGLTLDQVSAETHVRRDYLQALEEERFESLRLPTVNVRGYLTAFAGAVGLAEAGFVPAYMEKFIAWQARHQPR